MSVYIRKALFNLAILSVRGKLIDLKAKGFTHYKPH